MNNLLHNFNKSLNNLIDFALDNLLFEGEVALFAFICLLFVLNLIWSYNSLNNNYINNNQYAKKTIIVFTINLNLFFFLGQLAIHLYSLIF